MTLKKYNTLDQDEKCLDKQSLSGGIKSKLITCTKQEIHYSVDVSREAKETIIHSLDRILYRRALWIPMADGNEINYSLCG